MGKRDEFGIPKIPPPRKATPQDRQPPKTIHPTLSETQLSDMNLTAYSSVVGNTPRKAPPLVGAVPQVSSQGQTYWAPAPQQNQLPISSIRQISNEELVSFDPRARTYLTRRGGYVAETYLQSHCEEVASSSGSGIDPQTVVLLLRLSAAEARSTAMQTLLMQHENALDSHDAKLKYSDTTVASINDDLAGVVRLIGATPVGAGQFAFNSTTAGAQFAQAARSPSTQSTVTEMPMLEQLIKLYHAYRLQDVRSPIPHLAGPPGVGKSTVVQQLATLLGVRLHIVNVSRLSPLEIEGVQMPVVHPDDDTQQRLKMLHSTLWTNLQEGDIVLLDEFMRGFPEVYNGLLDIITSREVAGYKLPKVFFIAASNSVAAYDKALDDRLLHIFVADIRTDAKARDRVKRLIVEECGLLPQMATSVEMDSVLSTEVFPMYQILDSFKRNNQTGAASTVTGNSVRKLIGQLQLREVQSTTLAEMVEMNNRLAMQQGKPQFVVLMNGKNPDKKYESAARRLVGNTKLTQIQAINLELNLQLIEMQEALKESTEKEEEIDVTDLD